MTLSTSQLKTSRYLGLSWSSCHNFQITFSHNWFNSTFISFHNSFFSKNDSDQQTDLFPPCHWLLAHLVCSGSLPTWTWTRRRQLQLGHLLHLVTHCSIFFSLTDGGGTVPTPYCLGSPFLHQQVALARASPTRLLYRELLHASHVGNKNIYDFFSCMRYPIWNVFAQGFKIDAWILS